MKLFLKLAKLMKNKQLIRLLFVNLLLMIFFAIIYKLIDKEQEQSFSQDKKMSMLDSIYYSVVTHTTVGYGDISPKSNKARIATILHILFVLIISMFEINLLF